MFKKTMMLAIAVGAVAALSVAATVSASPWKHHQTAIQENRQIHFEGKAKFAAGIVGSIECPTTARATFEPGTTGAITEFISTNATACVTGGALANCQVHQVQSTGLPWIIHNNGTTVHATSGEIHNELTGGFCPVKTSTVTGGTITLTPNQKSTVTTLTLSGQVEVHNAGSHNPVDPQQTQVAVVSGTQTITAPEKHTYSL